MSLSVNPISSAGVQRTNTYNSVVRNQRTDMLQEEKGQAGAQPRQSPVTAATPSAAPAAGSGQTITEELGEHKQIMTTNSPTAPVSATIDTKSLYQLANKYLYGTSSQTWAKIDQDGDGAWSRSELQDYADAYHKATGRTIDVDDIMDTYAGQYGVVVAGQSQMYEDDALGIAYLNEAIAAADRNPNTFYTVTSGAAATSGTFNKSAFDDLVSNFVYGSGSKLYLSIDKQDYAGRQDGMWSMDELQAYANAYEKAFGVRLNVENIMAKYDKTGNGLLSYSEQNAIYQDDALGLWRIKDAMQAEQGKPAQEDKGYTINFGDYQKNLPFSRQEMGKLAGVFSASIQKAAMLDAFTSANMLMNNRYRLSPSGLQGFGMGTYSAWNYHNLSMLGAFV